MVNGVISRETNIAFRLNLMQILKACRNAVTSSSSEVEGGNLILNLISRPLDLVFEFALFPK